MRVSMFFLLFALIFHASFLCAMEQQPTSIENVFDIVKEEHQGTLADDTTEDSLSVAEQTIQEQINGYVDGQLNLTDRAKFIRACQLLKQATHNKPQKKILDKDIRHDLNILSGNHNTPTECLANKVSPYINSAGGKALLCAQLIQPEKSSTLLHNDQQLIQSLIPHLAALKEHLTAIGASEHGFLSFCDPNDQLYSALVKEKIEVPFANNYEIIKNCQEFINHNEWALLGKKLFENHGGMFLQIAMTCLRISSGLDSMGGAADAIYSTSTTGYGMTQWKKSHDIMYCVVQAMHRKLKCLRTFVHALDNLGTIVSHIANTPDLERCAKALKLDRSNKLLKLTTLLNSDTFKNAPLEWHQEGHITAAYILINECKDKLLSPYATVSVLDSLVNAALLTTQHPSRFIFPHYDINLPKKPSIKAKNYWNPFLNPTTSTTNTVSLGSNGRNSYRVMVVTGKNGRGKTVNTTLAISLMVLMAQTIGIAPAEDFVFNPNITLVTMIKCESNTGQDRSLFQEIAHRAGDVLQALNDTSAAYLVVLDEPFAGGANIDLSEASAYQLVEDISKKSNALCVVTTHFKDIPQKLAANRPFKNFMATDDFHIIEGIGGFDLEAAMNVIRKEMGASFAQKVNARLESKNNEN